MRGPPRRDAAADWYRPQEPQDTAEVSQKAVVVGPAADVVDVVLDVALAVPSEANHLLHPRPDLVVTVLGLGEVEDQAVHALHLVLDELHVATNTAEELCLVDKDGGEAAKEGVQGARGVHLRPPLHSLWISV